MSSPIGYESSSVAGLAGLHTLLGEDLDEVRGGFRTLHGQLDQPRVIMSSDYLLQVTGQASASIDVATEHLRVFKEAWTAEAFGYRTADRERRPIFSGRGESERRREMRIAAAVSGFFIACGSTLDAIAAATIGVLGLPRDLVTAGWPLAPAPIDQERLLAPPNTLARRIQTEAFAALDAAIRHGPTGWLPWMLGMRHTLIHRAQRVDMRRFYRVSKRDQLAYVMHLPKEPQLTDVEAMVVGSDAGDLWLWEHAGDTMAGVLRELMLVADVFGLELTRVWRLRQADPAVIVQPEKQWRDLFPVRRDLVGFAGFGPAVPSVQGGESMHVSPLSAKRFIAAKLLERSDQQPEFWPQALVLRDQRRAAGRR